jgi:outer membrane protein OmpU
VVNQLFKIEGKKMKKVLLATTALVMTTGYAAAEVSFSGKASAGISSKSTTTPAVAAAAASSDLSGLDANGAITTTEANIVTVLQGTKSVAAAAATTTDTSEVFSGIDLNVSASVTTDNGLTITVADDFGGGMIADYDDDYAVEAQTSDLDTPGVTISGGGLSLTVDNQAIDDRYDDSQNGDIGVEMNFAGNDIGITLDTDPATGEAGMSYSLSGAAGAISYGLKGTDSNDNNKSAFEYKVSYDMSGMTIAFDSDKEDDADAINTFAITAPLGAMSVTISADDNEDWNASVSYSAGALGFSYATDEESAWETHATYSLGGGATAYVAATDASEFSVAGVEFSF